MAQSDVQSRRTFCQGLFEKNLNRQKWSCMGLTNQLQVPYYYQRNTGKKPSAKLTTAFSVATTPTWRPTWRFPPPSTSPDFSKMSKNMSKPASLVSNESNPIWSQRHCNNCQFRNNQTGGSTLTYSGLCWQPTATKNTSYASRMLSPNMLLSHPSRIRMLKQ